jgi:signal transduction histidine kinase/DNA-binding response OmpR family regulator
MAPFREPMTALDPLPTVLVVEDEPAILDGLESLFAVSGFVVARAADGGLADARLARERFDLVVLDLMLPTLPGLEVLRRLRGRGDDTPVLVLTAKGAEEDVVLGLESGADDYVTKPFAIRELVARSKGLLRRPRSAGSAKRVAIGLASLDLDRHELAAGAVTVRLTMRESMFLAYLAERAPGTATREELLVDVWGPRRGKSCSWTCGAIATEPSARAPSTSTCSSCARSSARSRARAIGSRPCAAAAIGSRPRRHERSTSRSSVRPADDLARAPRRTAPRGGPMKPTRAALRSVLALALPMLLLGAGWMWSSLRERDARIAEERARLSAALEGARSAIDAGLRELVAREDERPFYVYSHYYSPPEVLALTDPVALSPLASEAGDPRIVGHFELDPDGTIRTPYSVDPGPSTDRARRVLEALDDDALAAMLAELGETSAGNLVASAPEPPPTPAPRVRIVRTYPDAGTSSADPNPLAQVGNAIASDINAAQAGDVEAYERVQSRGRAVPRVSRRDVAPSPEQQAVQQVLFEPQPQPQQPEPQVLRQPQVLPQPTIRRVVIPSPPPPPSMPPLVQGEIEVDYSPMALEAHGDALILTRIVSHGDARVLDGVVLDRARIVDTWMPETIARAVPSDRPTVVTASTPPDACAAREPASALLPGIALCAPAAPLVATQATLDRSLRIEVAILVVLLVLSAIAAWVILRAARRAADLARQRSAFVSAVSHELRTPLTTLRMHAEMLDEGLVPEERRAKVHAELVTESVRLARLVENVLEISRIEEGRRPLRASRADLVEHVRRVLEGERGRARSRGFALELRSSEDELAMLFDAVAIEQIVTNAIDNALKYAASATEKRVDVSILRAARDGRPGVEIRVRDHGPGIAPSDRERVFERFHRVERPETAHQPGTGLGLALVRELARAHGGEATILGADPGMQLVVWLPLG